MTSTDYVFQIKFECSKCNELLAVEKKIADILSDICEAGWPICPECGGDMEVNVTN